jgi:hypothetical protein
MIFQILHHTFTSVSRINFLEMKSCLQHGQVNSKPGNFFSLGVAEKSFAVDCVCPKVASHCRMQSS